MLIAAQPLHGDLDTISESMDDLVAAAVVLTMLVDSDADDDMEQEVNAGECNGDLRSIDHRGVQFGEQGERRRSS